MRHPSFHARHAPDRIAYAMAGPDGETGETLTFAQLDAASNRVAHALRALGLRAGDHIAFMLENRLELLALAWGAQRSGVIFTAISRYLTADEAAYIVADCGARLFVTSQRHGETASAIRGLVGTASHWMMLGAPAEGYASWDALTADMPATPVADESAGAAMLYSSGTTGRPKGIRRQYPVAGIEYRNPVVGPVFEGLAGMDGDAVYLSPAPLYHSAPLAGAMLAASLGATTIVMERFDEAAFLALVERRRVTHTQVVPTMFVRLLKLPDAARTRHDVSSLQGVIHVAAPCPAGVKRAIIEWLGPIVVEYYAGTEGNGVVACTSREWLAHPGTVGRPLAGAIHILDEERRVMPVGETGDVFFDCGLAFSYHGDAAKTAGAFSPQGWSTLGDIGRLDEDGYLYLTDRRAYTIITGGVNVYPQEIEDRLILHPAVADVAVFGVPDEELGEAVQAVVQPAPGAAPDRAELTAWCRAALSSIKTPKAIDFRDALPRTPTGKLMKRLLRDEYRAHAAVSARTGA